VGAVEGVVSAAAELLPSPGGGGDADFDGCSGAAEGADQLVMEVLVVFPLPLQEVSFVPVVWGVFRVWLKGGRLGCLARQGAGLGGKEVTPTEEGLGVEAC
jgi:hypothetical protein